jgi:hypothetical protein
MPSIYIVTSHLLFNLGTRLRRCNLPQIILIPEFSLTPERLFSDVSARLVAGMLELRASLW